MMVQTRNQPTNQPTDQPTDRPISPLEATFTGRFNFKRFGSCGANTLHSNEQIFEMKLEGRQLIAIQDRTGSSPSQVSQRVGAST